MNSIARRGLTLVELLVVLSVLSVFTVILVPVLAQARGKSCVANYTSRPQTTEATSFKR